MVVCLVQAARIRAVAVHRQAEREDSCRGRVVALAAHVDEVARAGLGPPGRNTGFQAEDWLARRNVWKLAR